MPAAHPRSSWEPCASCVHRPWRCWSDIAVFGIGGDLHDEGGQLSFRQSTIGHGAWQQQSAERVPRPAQPDGGYSSGRSFQIQSLVGFLSQYWQIQFTWVTVTSRRLRLTRSRCWHPADRRTARCRPSRSVRSRSRRGHAQGHRAEARLVMAQVALAFFDLQLGATPPFLPNRSMTTRLPSTAIFSVVVQPRSRWSRSLYR